MAATPAPIYTGRRFFGGPVALGRVPESDSGGGMFIIGYYRYGVKGERQETKIQVRVRV